MNSEHPDHPVNPRFAEDVGGFIVSGGPPRYARHTGRPVQYAAISDSDGQVIAYVWGNDEDEAGGVQARSAAGHAVVNEAGVWGRRLRSAKERGLKPSQALAELLATPSTSPRSHIVPGSLTQAESLAVLDELTGRKWHRDTTKRGSTAAIFGLAIGDALGYPTEFLDIARLTGRYGSWRQLELPVHSGVARVSDDTQMTLAVIEALADVTDHGVSSLTAATIEPALRARFVAWLRSPDNDRAPGRTCLDACAALERGVPWQEATVMASKGCGANMRVAPVGLLPGLTAEQRAGTAQLQAALTHGHPTALAASDLTAHAVWLLTHNCHPSELLPRLRHYGRSARRTYHGDWLGDLAQRAGAADPAAFIAHGWDETLAALDTVSAALDRPDPERDPCEVVGAGWIAEEALATALYCFLLFPEEPVAVVRRAAFSSGDSDSVAALAGALAGASVGGSAWPADWVRALEYGDRVRPLVSFWDSGDPKVYRGPAGRRP
ncbi:ADP-ribosylglycohydrolase [Streptomyces prasinopilosus]|uniref:ADP-ribosylglycohydrolase n=1 Tax=Streptomyces prasinopilosus TaxID=67344 RepID=A0A1G6P9J6_9ACTN|nr:ADP-ribosylglycohydrolase [Streptomyces prasinopilosus]